MRLSLVILSLMIMASGAVAQIPEDRAAITGDFGSNSLFVREDRPTSSAGATNRYIGGKADQGGRQYTNATMCNGLDWTQTCSAAETATASRAILAAAGSGIRSLVSSVNCYNISAVPSEITLLDGATAKWKGYLAANSNVTFPVVPPIRGTANTAFNFQMTTTATSTICCASSCLANDF